MLTKMSVDKVLMKPKSFTKKVPTKTQKLYQKIFERKTCEQLNKIISLIAKDNHQLLYQGYFKE